MAKNSSKSKIAPVVPKKRTLSAELPSASPDNTNEGTFRGFIENLPVMFYAVTPKPPHMPIYISPTFERFGYPIKDWLTKPDIWDRVIHPDDRDDVLGKTREAMREGRSIDFEYRVVCKDGEVVWVRDRSCFIKDKDGTPLCWQGVILDITERIQASDALKESEERYRQLFENANDIAYVHDLNGNYISINKAAERIIGYTREEVQSMNMTNIIAPEHLEFSEQQLAEKLSGKTEQTVYEVDCIKKDGHRITLEVNSGVIFKDGEPIAVQGIARDITAWKLEKDALRESETKFRTLAETASDAIITIDETSTILFANAGAEKIFGYSVEEILDQKLTILMPERFRKGHRAGISRFHSTGERNISWKSVQLPGLKKDGTEIPLELSFAEYSKDGKRYFTSIIRDITERKRAEDTITQSEERYRDLFENANDLIYTHDLKGNFTSLNRAGEVIIGFSREETLKMNIGQVVAPEFIELARTMTARKIESERPTTYELEIIAKQGHRVTLELSTRLIVSPDGLPVGVQGVGRDISERRRTEKSLHEALSLFSTTFESTADGIVVMSLDRQIVTCNKKFIEMWNVDDKIIAEKDGGALVRLVASHLKDPDAFLRKLSETYETPEETISEILELKDGRMLERYSQPQYLEGTPIGRVASFRDITERTRAEERLRYYALHDTLTDLPNRVEFMNHLRQAVDRAEGNTYARFAVLFLDLDRFKVINDSLGHAVGDKLLIAIAERLKTCVRPGDVVARLGGDEFTILLNRSGDSTEVAGVAERLQTKISEPFKIDNYEVFTTASIGIVVSSTVRRTAEDFLRDADAAMYRAKEAGKARYEIFDREMHVRNMNLLQVETDLRHAVERNEFEVLYQPIVELTTGLVDEFEALIRWRHPVHGLVNPNEFIHVAEETGLIIPIGKWILDESCRQIAEWQRRFRLPLSVSVNLSAKQLMHPNLTSQVKDALLDTGLDPSQLKLEVTESTVMEHSEKSLKVLSDLDHLGVALSTDDFGTGYSSLSYLQKFPFERLKIDRSFINIMDQDEKSGAIVKTILMLGENLRLEVVAEGIETAPQLEKLRSLGCVKGQGYLFSRPIDRETAEAFLESGANVFADNPALEFTSPGPMIEVSDVQ